MADLNNIQNFEEDITDNNCPKGVKNVQHLYLAIIGILPFIILINTFFYSVSISYFFQMLFMYLLNLGIYYGISRIKNWVVILVLLVSYWGALQSVMGLLQPYSDVSELIESRIFSTLFICFFVYQIIVFSRKETKEYFKVKGKVII